MSDAAPPPPAVPPPAVLDSVPWFAKTPVPDPLARVKSPFIRSSAPLAFSGVVQNDAGGQAMVRVEHVARGALAIGQTCSSIVP